jgi:uncharacterized protein DUF1045
MLSPRYAIAYTPPPSSPLARFGAEILGYDCFEGVDVPHLRLGRLDPAILALATRESRRHGFHAPLVAPFRLNGSHQEDLVAAIDHFARRLAPILIGPLIVAPLDCVVALVPLQPEPGLVALAAACLKEFDRFGAPLSSAEREQRKIDGLTARQLQLLHRWGDPYVLDEFRFRMTLAGPLSASEVALLAELLAAAFSSLAHDYVELDAISLMRQDDDDERFHVLTRCRLTGG